MGLDSYIYRVHREAVKQFVDFNIDRDKYNVEEFGYFRKNSALHSFCGEFYDTFGGTDKEFNGCNLHLTQNIVRELRRRLDSGKLEGAGGFCWGSMSELKYEQLSVVTDDILKAYEDTANYVFVYNGNY